MENLYRSSSKQGFPDGSVSKEGSIVLQEAEERRSWFARILYSAYGQLFIAAYVGFANIGMWNALNTIGGFGTGDEHISRVAMTTFDGVAVIGGFVAGSLVNWYGYKWMCLVSSLATTLFVSTVFLVFYYAIPLRALYLAITAVIVGLLDGCMFAAIGSIAINYSLAHQHSIFLAIYSTVLNIGGLLGGSISLMMSLDLDGTVADESSGGLSKPNFIALLIILMSGIPASLMLSKPERVRRSDGSQPPIVGEMTMRQEWEGIIVGLRDRYVWLLLPIFMCTIWHEVVLFNYFNIAYFNVRSRAMNAVYYYLGRTLISFPFQLVCDAPKTVPNQMLAGVGFTAMLCAIAGTTAIMTLSDAFGVRSAGQLLDFTDAHSAFLAICFFTYGAMESVATSFSLWIIGHLPTKDTAMMNRYFGWSRVGGAFGGFMPWLLDSLDRIPHDVQYYISAALWICALGCIMILQFDLRRKDENSSTEGQEIRASKSLMTISPESSKESDRLVIIPYEERNARSKGLYQKCKNTVLYTGYGQLCVASYSAFAHIGMWNALDTIGGVGTGDIVLTQVAMTALEGVSVFGGFFAGSAVNFLGLRRASLAGSFTLFFFIGSIYLAHFYNIKGRLYWVAGTAVLCGANIGWLMTSIGAASIHHALESQRTKFLVIYNVFLNAGGLAGSVLSFIMSLQENHSAASNETIKGLSQINYLVIMMVMWTGMIAGMLLQKPESVVRSDGTRSPKVEERTVRQEWNGIILGLRESYLWLMLPMFMCSVWHEVSLFNWLNTNYFNVRTRALNGVYYYIGRIFVAFPFQFVCDKPKQLPHRILAGIIFTACLCVIAFTTALMAITDVAGLRSSEYLVDFTEGRSAYMAICFCVYGAMETVASTFSMWLIGSLPFNDPAMSNRFVGWYRVGASFGGFAPWLLDTTRLVRNDVQWTVSAILWIVALAAYFYLYNDVRRGMRLKCSRPLREPTF